METAFAHLTLKEQSRKEILAMSFHIEESCDFVHVGIFALWRRHMPLPGGGIFGGKRVECEDEIDS